jgi:hypothetical protein
VKNNSLLIFNKYFVSIADSVISDNNKCTSANTTNPINYLLDVSSRPFMKMNWQCTSTREIDKIIKSLKTKILVDTIKYQVE